jgi:hypothetical protein
MGELNVVGNTSLESSYPEIAGSVDTASQKHKPISLHKLALPGDLLTGTMDASKSTKLMADILQVCQAWLPQVFLFCCPFYKLSQDLSDRELYEIVGVNDDGG